MDSGEEVEIVIVGAGICGLATALALHRKGIESVVLERSEKLQALGAAIGILTNGWHALHSLGVAHKLRPTAIPLQWKGEARCVKRSDLINILAEDLPQGTIRFGFLVISVETDSLTNFHTLRLHNGSNLKAKILIGCDGASSIVAEYLKLKPRKVFPAYAVRGLTYYSNSHGFIHEFVRTHGNNVVCGRSPITKNLVYWSILLPTFSPQDPEIVKDPKLIKKIVQHRLIETNFPNEISEMIKGCDTNSISLTRLTYKKSWDILQGTFRKGTSTVGGDAMHVMCPFLGQAGSAALEDAIVLARHLSRALHRDHMNIFDEFHRQKVGEAMDLYVKERRMRLVALSAQSYLLGLLLMSVSTTRKLLLFVLIVVLFRGSAYHTRYNCGCL